MNRHQNVERSFAGSVAACGISRASGLDEIADAHGCYFIECRGPDGALKWSESIDNLVTTTGKNHALDQHLSGASYTAAWYLGLIGAAGFTSGVSADDTAASHPGWVESTSYSSASRPSASFSAAISGGKSLSSAAVFSFTADVTIKGCFLASSSVKGGASGILYSAGLFPAGDKVVQSGDSLSVSYTATL